MNRNIKQSHTGQHQYPFTNEKTQQSICIMTQNRSVFYYK